MYLISSVTCRQVFDSTALAAYRALFPPRTRAWSPPLLSAPSAGPSAVASCNFSFGPPRASLLIFTIHRHLHHLLPQLTPPAKHQFFNGYFFAPGQIGSALFFSWCCFFSYPLHRFQWLPLLFLSQNPGKPLNRLPRVAPLTTTTHRR